MKSPNPKRCRELGMVFLFLNLDVPPEAHVNMMEGHFTACGTVACHAGWFAVSQGKDSRCSADPGGSYNYLQAADEISEFLGLKDQCELQQWAKENPILWGNENGESMFCAHEAFTGGAFSERTNLEQIGLHWLQVADRIEAAT